MSDLRKAALAVVHAWDTDGPVSTMEDLRAALAQERSDVQPEQEPVLWEIWPRMGGSPYYSRKKPADTDYVEFTPLYTAPPHRKPLTEEEIEVIRVKEEFDQWGIREGAFKYCARAIERKHGIGI